MGELLRPVASKRCARDLKLRIQSKESGDRVASFAHEIMRAPCDGQTVRNRQPTTRKPADYSPRMFLNAAVCPAGSFTLDITSMMVIV